MLKKLNLLRAAVALLLVNLAANAAAFGVDKIVLKMDSSPLFKTKAEISIFNDSSPSVIFARAKVFNWEMGEDGQFQLTPTTDIKVSPAVQRIGPGDQAKFKFENRSIVGKKERSYRVQFQEIVLPPDATTTTLIENTEGAANSGLTVGLTFTVPIFVDDFSVPATKGAELLDRVSLQRGDGYALMSNDDRRHLTVIGYRTAGGDSSAQLGVVLPGHTRKFKLPDPAITAFKVKSNDYEVWIDVKQH